MNRICTVAAGVLLVMMTCVVLGSQEQPPIPVMEILGLGSPMDVAVDSAGNIFVTDRVPHKVFKFNKNGNWVTDWGSQGNGDGQFNQPRGIAIDSQDNVLVVDIHGCRVQKFDNDGNFLFSWHGTGDGFIDGPFGVTVDDDDSVYVGLWQRSAPMILTFDSAGNYLDRWGPLGTGDGQLDFPRGLAVDHLGNVFASEQFNYRVSKFDSLGNFLASWASGYGSPMDVEVDSNGNVYTVAGNWVVKYDGFGNMLTSWTTGYGGAQGLGIDKNGNVYIALTGDQRVVKFSSPVPSLACTGFQPPMAAGPVTARGNRALPLKAQLFDADGYEMTDLDFTAPPVLQVMFQSNGGDPQDVTDDALPAGFGTEGNEFEYNVGDGVWQYNLKTKDHTAAGTYTITIVSGDDSEYIIDPTCEAAFERLE